MRRLRVFGTQSGQYCANEIDPSKDLRKKLNVPIGELLRLFCFFTAPSVESDARPEASCKIEDSHVVDDRS
jgi:hypothetical protein